MNSVNALITKTKLFVTMYKWLLIPLVPIIIFIYIIFYLFYAQKNLSQPPATQQNTTKVSQTPAQTESSPQTEVSVSPSGQAEISPGVGQSYTLEQEVKDIAGGKIKLSDEAAGANGTSGGYPTVNGEADAGSTNQKTLSDGSTEYDIPSDDPNRPHMQVLNKDGLVIFRRILVSDTTLSDYAGFLTNPPYVAQGSTYYGPDAVILANPTLGIAVVYNPESNQVYEQYIFQAVSVSDFIKKYGKDISAYQP